MAKTTQPVHATTSSEAKPQDSSHRNLSGCRPAFNNSNQQTPKNNLNQKFNPRSKFPRKNPIGKATTTTKLDHRKEKEDLTTFSKDQLAKILKMGIQNVVL